MRVNQKCLILFDRKYVQQMPYQGSSGWAWRLEIRGQIIQTVKYADDLLLIAKEETVLQGMIDK